MDLNKIKSVILTKSFIPVALFIVVDIILLVFAVYLGNTTYNKQQDVVQQQYVSESLESNVDLIQTNKSLLSDRIEEYNSSLDKLIPDTETYFDVIAAIEQLGARTGVTVESYSINLSETTEEKLSLDLNLYGTSESISTLLRDYRYISGRFITNENISLTLGDEFTITFAINLIHKEYQPQQVIDAAVSPTSITQDDIAQMEKILEAMN